MTVQTRQHSTLSLPWPPDWPVLFDTPGEDRPLIVEIGFGYGQMLFHLAAQFPHANIIGVEVASRPLASVERKLIAHGVHNVRVMHGHAETLLGHMLHPASVSQIHVNFPDPWFKTGHAHKRVMKRWTVDAITSRLIPGGQFFLATDIDDYAKMSHALLSATPGLTNRFDTPWAASIDNRVTTKYEAKAVREGRTNKYFAYNRNDVPAPNVPLIGEQPMPNIVFHSQTPLQTVLDAFQRTAQSFHDEDVHVSLMNAYYNEHEGTLLFEAFVKEPTVEQHVGFLVARQFDGDGQHTLKLASFGHPRVAGFPAGRAQRKYCRPTPS
ncbi:MAG: tRNA (guanosine(46)-N7)-methyltransferase TrmB, partial [Chloroflexota bacterium]